MLLLLLLGAAAVGFAVGAVLGRWWTLLAIVPIGALIWTQGKLEGSLDAWLAFVFSVVLAAAMAAGVGVHRLRARTR